MVVVTAVIGLIKYCVRAQNLPVVGWGVVFHPSGIRSGSGSITLMRHVIDAGPKTNHALMSRGVCTSHNWWAHRLRRNDCLYGRAPMKN